MKTQRMEIKDITAQGSFEGLLSPYGNVDGGNDIVEVGAYAKNLKDQGPDRIVLWQHKSDMPIGKTTLEDRADGLWAKAQLNLSIQSGIDAYNILKFNAAAGLKSGLSIGFESIKDSIENGVRHLKEIKLWECSVVTFPMNEMALITSVKGRAERKDDFNEELSDIQLMDMGYQMFNALCYSLGSITWDSSMDRAAKISAAGTYIQQFSDAYLAYFPMFLDMLAEDYGGMEMMAARTALEKKAGRRNSAADTKSLKDAMDHADSIKTIISALVEDGAGDEGTPKGAASPTTPSEQAAETKTEPVEDHSAFSSLLQIYKEGLQWSPKSQHLSKSN